MLRDPCEYASAVVGGGRGIPTAQVAISVASGEAASIAVAAPALEEHRRGLVDELMASPYLTRFPTSLDPSPFPTTIRFSERPEHPLTPVPQWWPERPRRPLVYLTFGTVLGYMSIAEDVFRTALSAVADLDVRVLLTVGHRVEGSTLSPIPANVHVEPWVDQDAVLAEADLVVCHGGSGTVFGALGAGIPVVCVPLFADQFENASRVAKVGAGVTVLSSKAGPGATREVIEAGDAPRIARAIETVLDTAAYRESAGRVEAEMAATAPVEDVLDGLLARRPPGRSPRADATPSPGPR